MIDYKQIQSIIDNNNSFVITTHVNPDGDAIGSELALHYYLKALGKDFKVINYSDTPYNLLFLDSTKVIQKFDKLTHTDLIKSADVLFAIDFNQLDRIVEMEQAFRESKSIKVCIDHHQDAENFTENLFIDADYASTGEMIYQLIVENSRVEIDYNIALQLYAAIMTDTGSFRYERTTQKTHLIAAELLSKGIDQKWIYMEIHDRGSLGRLKLLARALSTIRLNSSGEISSMTLTKKDLIETGSTEEDIDGFVNYCLSIKGVKIALLFFELVDGFKISFRSVGDIPANKLAAEFGGGGHYHAAGARVKNKRVKNYKSEVIEAAKKFLK